jgi:hypothetical protein
MESIAMSKRNCSHTRAAKPLSGKRMRNLFPAIALSLALAGVANASDHLDSPASVANPASDIADVYAWTSPDGKRLNIALAVQGRSFSDKVDYALHIDSGRKFGETSASVDLVCRFGAPNAATCTLGDVDALAGDATAVAGLESRERHFRLYAGRRDDPFYNNIKGLLGAYAAAAAAVRNGAPVDGAGCATFDESTVTAIRDQMQHTDGGPAQNFLRDWSVSAIVASIDLRVVAKGGPILAVWGTTSVAGKQVDRMARPFVGNTLLGAAPFSEDEPSGKRRQAYNEVAPAGGTDFIGDLEKSLAFQDSLDGQCGNQWLAGRDDTRSRYRALAELFADDRLWVNRASRVCTQFFAVELASERGTKSLTSDCGGRSPTYDAPNVWRSLVIAGAPTGIDDGLHEDEHRPSATEFPFFAAPAANAIDH